MNNLNPAECELVAPGAARGSNCAPCLAYHIAAARKAGLCDRQIAQAIALAEHVRQVPARAALDAARRALPDETPMQPGCGVAAAATPCG